MGSEVPYHYQGQIYRHKDGHKAEEYWILHNVNLNDLTKHDSDSPLKIITIMFCHFYSNILRPACL